MSHAQALYQWTDRVQHLFPDLKPHHARSLALYSFGLALAQCCGLSTIVTRLASLFCWSYHTVRQRLRELYQPASVQRGCARSEFDYTLCFGPLLRWAASTQADKRLVLALDPTCHLDRFRVLAVSVLYQGGGIPVAWAVHRAHDKGSWNAIWVDLLGRLQEALGEGWTVLVLTDRGLESPELFRAIVALGWHPLMRVKKGGKFQPHGWRKGDWMNAFASDVGRRWAGEGLAYPTGEKLACTLLACWEAGYEEPWLLLTDLPSGSAHPGWYAWRMWIEQGFKTLKSGCWQWQHTRMQEAVRAARLWAVLALATLWMVEVGGEGEAMDWPEFPLLKKKKGRGRQGPGVKSRNVSLVKTGVIRLWAALLRGEGLPVGQLVPQGPWPEWDWHPDLLTEDLMNHC